MDIKITIKDKIAVLEEPARIVCGNSDYVAVFSFDEEWAHYELKTARFIHGGKHTDVPFTGDRCPIPKMRGVRSLYIGVYAGDLHTTTPAPVDCVKSIRCDSGTPAEPAPDVYAQIMEMIHEASRVYVLEEGETTADAPADADLIIDPYSEGGGSVGGGGTIDPEALTGFVRYDTAQTLNSAQEMQARDNIGAASSGDVSDIVRGLGVLMNSGSFRWSGVVGNRFSVVLVENEDVAVKFVRVTDKVPQKEPSSLVGICSLVISSEGLASALPVEFEYLDGVWVSQLDWLPLVIIAYDDIDAGEFGSLKKGVYFLCMTVGTGDGEYAVGFVSSLSLQGEEFENDVIINSSTEGSKKQFKITVDDSGTISATEVT